MYAQVMYVSSYVVGGQFNTKNIFLGSRLATPKGREFFLKGK